MLHDDLAKRLRLGVHWPGRPAPLKTVPRAAPTIRSELFDQLAAVHESAHCVWNHIKREPIHSVEIEGRGIGGGEFKATPTSGSIELRDTQTLGRKMRLTALLIIGARGRRCQFHRFRIPS
jgi:hypothetical protein